MNDLSDSLNAILNDPDKMEEVRSMLGNFSGGNSSSDLDMAKIQNLYQKFNSSSDPRMELLSAIRPYMSSRRAEGLDKMTRMLRMTRLASLFREMDF